MMGSPDGKNGEAEAGRYDNEAQHQVILTQGYWLAETACTQALWQAVTGDNPSSFKDANNPVENVSWQDVTDKFLKRVNKQYPQLKLRLPTEAEWENACRAGTTGAFNFEGELSLDKVNYSGIFGESGWAEGALHKTAAVKSYPPNQWGLYEMHGNVWEWCKDLYSDYPAGSVVDPLQEQIGSNRVLRGGSWIYNGRHCRSAYRDYSDPGARAGNFGFRLALGHELSPVRPGRAVQQPIGSHAAAARGGQAGDGQRGSSRRKKK
ncbi:formylglycine-generating enzyme family protein [Candidatus Thiothrix anitrata]|uniref:Formylglycine-generating enzyme family protein n=2 Tax=Candidatus Thiothrix anitrata TaxID=2823902 RepID=A0ABX7X9E3_9GAMM|nr:formylglycine-generating enzyme family protein [Candidatus Thiothrix anitrata]